MPPNLAQRMSALCIYAFMFILHVLWFMLKQEEEGEKASRFHNQSGSITSGGPQSRPPRGRLTTVGTSRDDCPRRLDCTCALIHTHIPTLNTHTLCRICICPHSVHRVHCHTKADRSSMSLHKIYFWAASTCDQQLPYIRENTQYTSNTQEVSPQFP